MMRDPASHPDADMDEWLAEQHHRMVTDLGSTLNIEAGLREAMIPARHADLVADLGDTLDVEAGLSAIVPTTPAPTSPEPRRLVGAAAVRGPATRFALLVGCSEYEDPKFKKLPADQDIETLERVLADPAIGDFTVDNPLLDEPSWVVRERIETFFANHQADDLLLLYFSCHGVLDARRRLYFAASDTRRESPESTGISARWVRKQINHSRSRRVVLLLDCCYSGAFTTDVQRRGPARGGRILKQLGGRGRVVITASDETEEIPSGFTDAMVRGLETGAADLDGDGQIEVGELYRYVRDQVRQNTSGQTPTMSVDGIRGPLNLARNSHAPSPLPVKLQQMLTSAAVWERLWALDGLQRLLASDHPGGEKLTARRTLLHLRDHDTDKSVQAATEKTLTELSPPPEPPSRHRRPRRAALVTVVLGVLLSLTSVFAVQQFTISHATPCAPSTRPADGMLSFGTLLPKTGRFIYTGLPMDAGVRLAIKDINDAGGIPRIGVKLDETNRRDEGDPSADTAKQSTNALLAGGVDAIIGPGTSAVAAKVIDEVTCAGVIMFSPSNTSPVFTTYPDRGLYFRTAPSNALEAPLLGELVVSDGNPTAVVVSRNDIYANPLREATEKEIRKFGGRVLDSFSYEPNDDEYNKVVQRVKAKNPEAIVLIGFTESAQILAKMTAEGIGPKNKHVYGSDSNMTSTLAGQASRQDPGILAGMRGVMPYAGSEVFVQRLREANPGLKDLTYAAQAYDAVVITSLAAAVAGTDEPAAIAKEINGITKNGERCTSFATCIMLVKERKDIEYVSPSGPLEFTDSGEPSSITYVISEIQADGTIKSLRSERVNQQVSR